MSARRALLCGPVAAVGGGSCALLGNPPVLHVFPLRQYDLPLPRPDR